MIDKDVYNPHMPYVERVEKLQKHPVLACRLFKSRLENIVQYIWQGKSEPLGRIVDYWIRLEFQIGMLYYNYKQRKLLIVYSYSILF